MNMGGKVRETTGFDFVGRSKLWLAIAAILILASVASLFTLKLNLGLEFTGGTSFEVVAENGAKPAEVRSALDTLGIEEAQIQRVGDSGYLVQTAHVDLEEQPKIAKGLADAVGAKVDQVTTNDVGPKWGRQISQKAVRALLIFLLIAAAYISLRFEPKMAVAALIALFHDLVITAGVYSLIGFVVTPATVIALLTILGYSLYDTVIVFDRVRDRSTAAQASSRMTYSELANESLNQVLWRSVNTTVTSLLPVGSLLFVGSFLLGATTLRELALALFLGMASGTYSSIFVAVPMLAWWKEKEPRWQQVRARQSARAAVATGAREVTSGASESEESPSAPRRDIKPPKTKRKKRR